MTKTLNSRTLQSIKTKNNIYESAIYLFSKKGIDNTTIQNICDLSNVSIGSFYNYFENKESILQETFQRADNDFKKMDFSNYDILSPYELIIEYMNYYIDFVQTNNFDFLKSFYNTSNKFFIKKNRAMQTVLKSKLKDKNLKLNKKYIKNIDDLVDKLFMTARGIIFHWCLLDGNFDLNKLVKEQIQISLDSYLL